MARRWVAAAALAALLSGTIAADQTPLTGASGARPSVSLAGDVNGDGTPDLSVWNVATGTSRVLSGTDGATLVERQPTGNERVVSWRRADTDVGGGPQHDLLRTAIVGLTADRSCNLAGRCTMREDWVWEVSAHGRVGGPAHWVHRIAAAVDSEDNVGAEDEVVQRRRDWVGTRDQLEVRVLGGSTVLVTVLSTTGRSSSAIGPEATHGATGLVPTLRESITAASLTSIGRDGQVLGERELSADAGRERYLDLGDVTGDGRADLLLEEYTGDFSVRTARLLDTRLREQWQRQLHEAVRIIPAPAGTDGRPRLAAIAPGITEMLDARTGSVIWRPDVYLAMGEVRGRFEALPYEAYAMGQTEDGETIHGVRLGRFDLETGTFGGFDRSLRFGTIDPSASIGSLGGFDVDGDGLLDLVGQEYRNGTSGGHLLTLTRSGNAFVGPDSVYAQPVEGVDLDGIAGDEVLWLGYDQRCPCWNEVFASRPGQRMWSLPRAEYDRLLPLDGDGPRAFIELGIASDGTFEVRRLDGATLDVRWSVPA